MKVRPVLAVSLSLLSLVLGGCVALELRRIPVPTLNPAECGCPDQTTRIKITIDGGATLCMPPDDGLGGDVWPVCWSDNAIKDTGCKVIDHPPSYSWEEVKCP